MTLELSEDRRWLQVSRAGRRIPWDAQPSPVGDVDLRVTCELVCADAAPHQVELAHPGGSR